MKYNRYHKHRRFFAALIFVCLAAFVSGGCGKDKETANLEEFREESEEADTTGLSGKDKTSGKDSGKNTTGETGGNTGAPPCEEEKAVVYVCGAVNSPGVYTLKTGSRVYEAIKAAGGIRSDGCGEILNQAEPVKDGERIYVPTKEEALESDFPGGGHNGPEKVNINTASREELMTLPGIGEAKADSIISYREQKGGFQSVEELKNVEGIKEGVFGRLKDKITV